jgi:iron complex transport system substrate-binding protein
VEEDAHPDVQGLPSVGSLIGPNTEAVLRLNPDIIIAPAGDLPVWAIGRVRPIQARLRPLSLGRLADQPRALRELGGWLGTESRADSVAEHLEAGFEAASGRAAEGPAVPVVWLVGDAPVLAVGAESLQADLLSLAGGLNVAEAAGAPFVPADPTLHLAADPLVVLWSGHPLDPTAGSASAAVRSAGLGSLSAVRNGRLFTLPRDFLEPSGSRSLQVIDSLFQMLHPTPAETPGADSTRF